MNSPAATEPAHAGVYNCFSSVLLVLLVRLAAGMLTGKQERHERIRAVARDEHSALLRHEEQVAVGALPACALHAVEPKLQRVCTKALRRRRVADGLLRPPASHATNVGTARGYLRLSPAAMSRKTASS